VLVVDDHRMITDALRVALSRQPELSVVGVAYDGEEGVDAALRRRPDVVLMDVQLPGVDGIEATRRIREAEPEVRVVALSAFPDETQVARAVEAGVAGFLPKDTSIRDLARALRRVGRGESLLSPEDRRRAEALLRRRRELHDSVRQRVERLTPRETEILQRMADGMTPERIAEDLGISPHTLRTHVQNVLLKLGVHSKLEALSHAIRYGKVTVREPAR
jgi:DNA-binding NarL/FixJ family response regulator